MPPTVKVIIFIISGIICYSITKKRNTNEYLWGAFGVFVGPLLIPFCFIPKKKTINTAESKTENEV